MADKSTFIKLDRNITKWRWYKNGNTMRVFLHLLIEANIEPHPFENIVINRGELATSYDKIANTLNLTNQQVRTAIQHLKSTGEITTKKYPKFQVISIVGYSYYQDKSTGKSTGKQQSINSQSTGKQQQLKNIKKNKEYKEEGCPSGVAPNGVEYYEINGKKYNAYGKEINDQGYELIDFGLSKSRVDF
jgi:hypothetical protein